LKKIGVISDIHGNINALENCYKELKNEYVNEIYFLGDAIGYLPEGYECFQFLQKNKIKCIKGNHEEMFLGNLSIKPSSREIYKLYKLQEKFSPLDKEILETWGNKISFNYQNLKYALVHGSPNDLTNGYIYPDTNLSKFENSEYDFIFCGHTHRPFIKSHKGKLFINVGSVGLPRDVGNLSSFVIADLTSNKIEIRRLEIKKHIIKSYKEDINVHISVKNLFDRKNDKKK